MATGMNRPLASCVYYVRQDVSLWGKLHPKILFPHKNQIKNRAVFCLSHIFNLLVSNATASVTKQQNSDEIIKPTVIIQVFLYDQQKNASLVVTISSFNPFSGFGLAWHPNQEIGEGSEEKELFEISERVPRH